MAVDNRCMHTIEILSFTLGYVANNYEGLDLSPRDQYFKHADGRDGGLGEIDPDSPEAFSDWYHNRECR